MDYILGGADHAKLSEIRGRFNEKRQGEWKISRIRHSFEHTEVSQNNQNLRDINSRSLLARESEVHQAPRTFTEISSHRAEPQFEATEEENRRGVFEAVVHPADGTRNSIELQTVHQRNERTNVSQNDAPRLLEESGMEVEALDTEKPVAKQAEAPAEVPVNGEPVPGEVKVPTPVEVTVNGEPVPGEVKVPTPVEALDTEKPVAKQAEAPAEVTVNGEPVPGEVKVPTPVEALDTEKPVAKQAEAPAEVPVNGEPVPGEVKVPTPVEVPVNGKAVAEEVKVPTPVEVPVNGKAVPFRAASSTRSHARMFLADCSPQHNSRIRHSARFAGLPSQTGSPKGDPP